MIFAGKLTLNPESPIIEGQDAKLNCSNTVCPTSDVSWKLNGVLLSRTGNELRIFSASKYDAGTYSCHPLYYKQMKFAEKAVIVMCK